MTRLSQRARRSQSGGASRFVLGSWVDARSTGRIDVEFCNDCSMHGIMDSWISTEAERPWVDQHGATREMPTTIGPLPARRGSSRFPHAHGCRGLVSGSSARIPVPTANPLEGAIYSSVKALTLDVDVRGDFDATT